MKYIANKIDNKFGDYNRRNKLCVKLKRNGPVFFWNVCYTEDLRMKGNPEKTLRPNFGAQISLLRDRGETTFQS